MHNRLSRRSFFRRSGLAAAGVLGAPAIVRANADVMFKPGDRPRRIIHLVSDGMSLATLTCADQLSHYTRQRGLAWLELTRRPDAANGLMETRSLNSLVTDSAAASSAWGSGSRVVNGAINVLPDGRALRTLYQLFGEQGWKRGLVTTAEVTHATPAGFAANVSSRATSETIADQYFDRRIEVLLGGGAKFFDPGTRKDQRDLRGEFVRAGYACLTTREQLRSAPVDHPWLGTFDRSHLPFTVDHQHDTALQQRIPTLAEMTEAALRRLGREEHFILQIEGARVDMAAHLNDPAGTLLDQIAFDDAVAAAVAFQQRHPDTLVVVTSDHGTGGPALNGAGKNYDRSVPLLKNVAAQQRSFAAIIQEITGAVTFDGEAYKYEGEAAARKTQADKVTAIVLEATGYKLSERRAARLCQAFAGKSDAPSDFMRSGTAELGQLLANHTGVSWTSLNHTSDHVPVVAVGPGAERFHGFLRNVDVFRHYTQLAKIDFQNPELPLMAECGPSAAAVEAMV
jgi:alkaline phosphatase